MRSQSLCHQPRWAQSGCVLVAEIEEWCAKVRTGLEMATFEDKLRNLALKALMQIPGWFFFPSNNGSNSHANSGPVGNSWQFAG